MHRFQQALSGLKDNLRDIEAKRTTLDEQEEAIRSAIEGIERLIALESSIPLKKSRAIVINDALCLKCQRPRHRGGCRGIKPVAVLRALKANNSTISALVCVICGGPRSIGSVSKCGKCYRAPAEKRRDEKNTTRVVQRSEAAPPIRAKNLTAEKDQQGREASQKLKDFKQKVRHPVEKSSDCGKCVTRVIDGKVFLAAAPDCPEHGIGMGVPQEGKDRKGDPMYVKATSG